jgi:glycosyltransferase involved in cell wall biosynthesis
VLEAISRGTPVIVVAAPDNAAAEFIENGINGFTASIPVDEIARAISLVYGRGSELRESTLRWFRQNANRLSLEHSLVALLVAMA